MNQNELQELFKSYDFIRNSKKSFSEKYGISIRTVDKYVNKYNIPYNKKQNKILITKDMSGRFCLNISNNMNIDKFECILDHNKNNFEKDSKRIKPIKNVTNGDILVNNILKHLK